MSQLSVFTLMAAVILTSSIVAGILGWREGWKPEYQLKETFKCATVGALHGGLLVLIGVALWFLAELIVLRP